MTTGNVRADYSGILNVDKPVGMTSHDVVDRVRHATGMRRVGHAGTLDPLASGVLLVCLGQATRVSEYLMDTTKIYRGTVRFGAASTTDDAEGILTLVPLPSSIDRRAVELAASRLVGDVDQIPPIYSAIKIAGKPLYARARAGETPPTVARPVRIDQIDVLTWNPPDATIEVTCSKGTYIRSIARDLGASLQSAAYLASLRRLSSGNFLVRDAVTLGEIERATRQTYLDRLLFPIDVALGATSAVVLNDAEARTVANGGRWLPSVTTSVERVRAYRRGGPMIALLEFRADNSGWYPQKVFALGDEHDVA